MPRQLQTTRCSRRVATLAVAVVGALALNSGTSGAQTTPPQPCAAPVVDFLGCPRDPTQQSDYAQLYRLGTFNMAGGNTGHGDKNATADALSKSIIGRGIDFMFLQEACKNMSDRLRKDLAPHGYKVDFLPTERTCVKRTHSRLRRDKHDRGGSAFGIAVAYRSSRSVFTIKLRDYLLPSNGFERRKMKCLRVFFPRPIVACSTHLTNNRPDRTQSSINDNRREQTTRIAEILEPFAAKGNAIFLGGDFNMKPADPSFDPLWDARYGGKADGSLIEVDSGPSIERGAGYARKAGDDTTGVGPFAKKIDYIFVRGVQVLNADVGRSSFSDHRPLWAEVLSPANQPTIASP